MHGFVVYRFPRRVNALHVECEPVRERHLYRRVDDADKGVNTVQLLHTIVHAPI